MAGETLRTIGEIDAKVLRGLRHFAPWVLGLIVMPLTIWGLRAMWADTLWIWLVFVLMMLGSGYLVWLVSKRTHARTSNLARWFGPAYTAISMTYLSLVVLVGMGDWPDSPQFILWAIGFPFMCIAWNVYYSKRDDVHDDSAVDIPKVKPKDVQAALPVGGAPVVVEGKVISDVTTVHPEVAKVIEKVNRDNAVMEAKAKNQAAQINAAKVLGGWKQLTRLKGPLEDLSRIKVRVVKSDDYATEAKLRLTDGVVPKNVESARGALATKYRVGATDVRIISNPRDNSDVTMRVIWYNPLEKTQWWGGPQHIGMSFGEQPIQFGLREDNKPALMLLPQSDKVGKNSSHVLVEGMNGSGKSETMLIVVGEGSTRPDVCFWAIDVAKGLQTFGSVLGALDWFITDRAQAKLMMRALVEFIIPARGTLLASLGYDNWTPEVGRRHGIPYLVVIVEEGAIIFESLGKKFVDVMLLARSVGICIWGSIQRAQHDMIDVNARAQFSEVLTFGMAKDEDVFGMPEEMLDMGASPQQWRNRMPGMHYHYTPLLADGDLVTPQRSFRADKAMLRRITDEYGPNMMRPEASLIANANRIPKFEGLYDNREDGYAVERRLKGAGGIALDDREAVAAATGGQAAPQVPAEDAIAADGTLSPELAEATRQRGEELRAAGVIPQQRESVTLTSAPAEKAGRNPYDDFDLGDEEEEEFDNDNGGAQAPEKDEVIFMKGQNGEPDRVFMDGEEVDLEDFEDDEMDEADELFSGMGHLDDEAPDVSGEYSDAAAATAVPQHPNAVLVFDDDDDDWEPSDSREGARRNLLRLLRTKGVGFVFRSGDLYDEPLLPYVDRAKSWIRAEIISLAEDGIYVERINDPSSPDDGKFVVTEHIDKVPFPGTPALMS